MRHNLYSMAEMRKFCKEGKMICLIAPFSGASFDSWLIRKRAVRAVRYKLITGG